MFQGAPGAGKSALMHECVAALTEHSTLEDPWVAAALPPSVLEYPEGAAKSIAVAVGRERERLAAAASRTRGSLETAAQRARRAIRSVTQRGAGVMGLQAGGRPARPPMDVQAAFRSIEQRCQGARVVLFVDEAQNLGEGAKEVLDALHRGQVGIALLPVFLGLGDTAGVLARRGISRLPAERLVEMPALRPEEARESLCMVFDAYGVHGHTREEWLDALTECSQGWPQHLNRIAVAACRILDGCGMNADAVSHADALAAGEAAKTEYYRDRLREVPGAYKGIYKRLAMLLADGRANDAVSEAEMAAVVEAAGEGYAEWLAKSIHWGLLAPTPASAERYRVPIPSLASHLLRLEVTPSPAATAGSAGDG